MRTRSPVTHARRLTAAIALLAASCAAALPTAAAAPAAAAPDRTVETLQKIADAAGPPGFEEPVRKVLVEMMKPLAASLTYDGMGSIIATQGSNGPHVMVDAHMDELGGMVRRITPNGLLTMQMLGGWLDQALPDKRWVIIGSKGPVKAITGIRDIHVVPADERTRVFARDGLFLDVGARSEAEVRALGISPGDPIVPDAPFEILNGTDNYLGKAWDDRVGCAVVVEAMRRLANEPHPNRISWVITTQEEIGLRGAHTAADVVKPDLGIAIEGGITGDVYPGRPEETQAKLGAGPGIFLYDSSALPNRKLSAFVKQTASERKLPLQLDLVQGYGDDSAEIQKSNGGVPTVNLVVPIRYTHAHNGILNRRDFDQMVDLLVSMLKKLDAGEVKRIRDFTPDSR
ncbi:M42 family metallopeptidase [Massilia forsythiae]|uniref:M42 family metallopeptidase n=1 Tax=Massilia forsythiae TaxID=2728020 RepID=A0A7Z2VW92_9BURK|nr:M42 family metallopeptidase [Massilia forsythiae]